MSKSVDQDKWNQRYSSSISVNKASRVLSQNLHLLPKTGVALDLACGSGANALLLAKQGLSTHAWDFSEVALVNLDTAARRAHLTIITELRDVVKHPPSKNSFDIIVVSRFLDRSIIDQLMAALKPKGLIFYQTFVATKNPAVGPNNSQYLLAENELLRLFSDLKLIVYREEAKIGQLDSGFRDQALIIAQR